MHTGKTIGSMAFELREVSLPTDFIKLWEVSPACLLSSWGQRASPQVTFRHKNHFPFLLFLFLCFYFHFLYDFVSCFLKWQFEIRYSDSFVVSATFKCSVLFHTKCDCFEKAPLELPLIKDMYVVISTSFAFKLPGTCNSPSALHVRVTESNTHSPQRCQSPNLRHPSGCLAMVG